MRGHVAHRGVVHEDRSIGELVRDIAAHTEEFVRAEIQLGIAEVRDEVSSVVRRGMFVIAGATLGLLAIVILLMAAVFAMALVIQLWLAALIVGLVVLLVAAVFLLKGAKPADSREIKPVPDTPAGERDRSWAIARAN